MKKLLSIIAVAALLFVTACNGPKDPPDEGIIKQAQETADSLARVDSLQTGK